MESKDAQPSQIIFYWSSTMQYQEITLPLNFYSDILRPFVAKLAPTLDDDQQADVCNAITYSPDCQNTLTDKFAPFCFYQIIEPKVRLVASKNNCEFELDNVNCFYQGGMVADCNLDATHFNIFLQLAFESEFAPYQNPQNSFVGNLAEGLAGYLLDAYFDELQAMLEPLLNGSEVAELVKSARLQALLHDSHTMANAVNCDFSGMVIKQIFNEIYDVALKLIFKRLIIPNHGGVVDFKHLVNYVINTIDGFGIGENDMEFATYLHYAKTFLEDCETFLADGAFFSLDMEEHIRIQQYGLLNDLHIQLDNLDAYCYFYIKDIDPKVTTVVFTSIVCTVSSRTY